MKRPDMIILIAIWEFLVATGSLVGIAAIALIAFPKVGTADFWVTFGLSVGILWLVAGSGIATVGGIGLLLGKGWGRILSIIQAALSLFWIPIGTVIGILILLYLAKSEVRNYFERTG